jgi:hypothetical protein
MSGYTNKTLSELESELATLREQIDDLIKDRLEFKMRADAVISLLVEENEELGKERDKLREEVLRDDQ